MSRPGSRGWWGRNWKWVVPVGCLTPVVLCSGLATLLVMQVHKTITTSEPYQFALTLAQTNEHVQQALGTPIEARFFVKSNISSRTGMLNSDIDGADLSISIYGPKGSAVLHVVGKKTGAEWTYSVLEVVIPGQQKNVDLLKDVP
jgi:hypothetical protein